MRVVVYDDAGKMMYDFGGDFIALCDKGEKTRCTIDCSKDFLVEGTQILVKELSAEMTLCELTETLVRMVANAIPEPEDEVLQ